MLIFSTGTGSKSFDLMEAPSPFSLLVFSVLLGFIVPSTSGLLKPSTNYTALVYKNCSGDVFTDSDESPHSRTLSSLFQELVSRSSRSKFYKATVGDSLSGVSGRFQCDAALTGSECHECVARIPEISRALCDKSIAAKIRLAGCYLQYETDQFSVQKAAISPRGGGGGIGGGGSKYEMDHKHCEESGEVEGIEGLVENRDAALEALEEGVLQGKEGEGGRYETEHGPFRVEAECEADLGPCDCGECVNAAVEVVKEECPKSVAGEVFLDRCLVRFQHYYGGGDGGGGFWNPEEEHEDGEESGKRIALVLGGAAALVLGFLFLLLLRSCGRKDDDF